ncbi:MAG: GtrA family protein [Patescibacteria group bacterium]|jgi:putative flippase GtrA
MTLVGIKNYIASAKHQIFKFLLIGGSATLIDVALLFLLKEKAHLPAVLAVALEQILIITYNFLLNKYWTFQSKNIPWQQLQRYFVLVAGNYLAAIFLMYFMHQILGFNYILVRLITIALMALINFILYKHWVYKEKI